MWKKFCLTLNTLALPNLITSDLVITHPMSSISGSITFLNYVAGSNKGGVKGNKFRQQADIFNSVYSLGEMDKPRMNYTGERVSEVITELTTIEVENPETGEVEEKQAYIPAWTPVRWAEIKLTEGWGELKVDYKTGGVYSDDYTLAVDDRIRYV